jgi:hypothetical protein
MKEEKFTTKGAQKKDEKEIEDNFPVPCNHSSLHALCG